MLSEQFDFAPYFSATLFKLGMALAAIQCGNLDAAQVSVKRGNRLEKSVFEKIIV